MLLHVGVNGIISGCRLFSTQLVEEHKLSSPSVKISPRVFVCYLLFVCVVQNAFDLMLVMTLKPQLS